MHKHFELAIGVPLKTDTAWKGMATTPVLLRLALISHDGLRSFAQVVPFDEEATVNGSFAHISATARKQQPGQWTASLVLASVKGWQSEKGSKALAPPSYAADVAAPLWDTPLVVLEMDALKMVCGVDAGPAAKRNAMTVLMEAARAKRTPVLVTVEDGRTGRDYGPQRLWVAMLPFFEELGCRQPLGCVFYSEEDKAAALPSLFRVAEGLYYVDAHWTNVLTHGAGEGGQREHILALARAGVCTTPSRSIQRRSRRRNELCSSKEQRKIPWNIPEYLILSEYFPLPP